ncbi:MAG: DUF2207 domain-containing protein [Candidatus Heimdallarchaeota archaeon]|nr:DUF2207 domain-containing protein [Candidatus Heimdallarchaeota archaeon]MBY8996069.1 DUF2207 domain-containing protein [Candidatus Heimdallarchaeota archaeon]
MTNTAIAKFTEPGDDVLTINGYYYSDWNQIINVGMDGSLLVEEEMTFHLDAGSYGFAYRDLKWQSFHDVVSWSIVSGPGTPSITSYKMEKESDIIQFYWEWSRQSVLSGTEYTFILTYNVSSAMDLRGNRDRVYWNVIGGEFEVPIYDIDTTVVFPKEYNISDVRSQTYYQGSDPGDDNGVVSNVGGKTIVTYHQGSVAAYESYTIDTDSPPAGINMPFSWRVYLNSNYFLVIAIGFVPIFIFFILAFLIKGIDPKAKAIPVLNEVAMKKCTECGYKDSRRIQYCPQCGNSMKTISEVGPPNDLSPAEVGTLLDEKFDKIDFVAEIFYLAEKGYLKIIQPEDTDEMYFQRTQKEEYLGNLSIFNKGIIGFIESNSHETLWFREQTAESDKPKGIAVEVTSLSTIKENVLSLWKHKDSVYNKLSGGDSKYFESNPEKVKSFYFGASIAAGIGGGVLLFFASSLFHISNLTWGILGVVIASVIGLALSFKMPKLTKHGAQMKASWQSYLQLIRGQIMGFPDPYEQFNFSMDHFSYLLIDPKFNLPAHLKHISSEISTRPPPTGYHFITPYWYFYPRIYIPRRGGLRHRPITGFDRAGRGFESAISGISNMAENLPKAISNMAEGLTSAISNMSESFTPPSSSGGSSGFGGGFSGGGGGGGGGGIG